MIEQATLIKDQKEKLSFPMIPTVQAYDSSPFFTGVVLADVLGTNQM
jgi:hypothetical protein